MTEHAALASSIARSLLQIGAVHLRPNDPFTWTSGIQSPIYCDNRLTLSYPEVRSAIAAGFCQVIREYYPDVEVIAGTATAGIPHAAWVADKLGLPMIYVRDKAKGHGRQNQIEGLLKPGQKTVVIEDLISTGGSSIKAAEAARVAGADVLAVAAIFTYQFAKAERAFAEAGIPLNTLSNYTALCQEALATGNIQPGDLDMLNRWREETGK